MASTGTTITRIPYCHRNTISLEHRNTISQEHQEHNFTGYCPSLSSINVGWAQTPTGNHPMACVRQCTSLHSSEVERLRGLHTKMTWILHHEIKLGVNSLHMIYGPGLLGTSSNFSMYNHSCITCLTLALSIASRVSAHIPLYMVRQETSVAW